MEPSERSWGITPVPDRLRTLSLLDVGLLWGNLGVSLLVLFTGTFLAGLGLQRALLATVVGAVLGTALLGLAGLIGFERRVPGMVLMRDPLGHRGSYAPTGLNVAQNLGWAVFELYVMSLAASALTDQLFGFEARWAWVLAFGALTAWLALAGPISFVRRYVRRFAVWAVAASLGYLVWWALDGADAGALWSAPGEGGITFWQGVDLTVAMAASWLPLAADYTRFSRSRRAAFWGTSVGLLRPARPPLRPRRPAGALARPGGAERHLHGHRGRRRGQRVRAPRAHGGRERRAVRERVLGGRLAPEHPSLGFAAVPRRGRRRRRDARSGPGRHPGVRDVPAPARLLLRAALRRSRRRLPARARVARWTCAGAGSRPGRPDSRSSSGSTRSARRGGSTRSPGSRAPGDATIGASLPAFALAFALYAGVRSAHAPLGRRRARLAGSR